MFLPPCADSRDTERLNAARQYRKKQSHNGKRVSMNLKNWIIIILVMVPVTAHSSDFMVELFEEHYKEKMIPGTGDMKVNHTWQVKTPFGNKVLILLGKDYNLRRWIRGYVKNHELWVVKIPDEGNDKFIYNMSVYLDIQQIQPVYSKKWSCGDCRHGPPPDKPSPPPLPAE